MHRRHKSPYLGRQVSPRSNPAQLIRLPTLTRLRSPGQNVSQADDIVDSIGTIRVRNHARAVAVKLQQQSLYQVQSYLRVAHKAGSFIPLISRTFSNEVLKHTGPE
jgi:hypothetical protein